jgi:hypothetical protein
MAAIESRMAAVTRAPIPSTWRSFRDEVRMAHVADYSGGSRLRIRYCRLRAATRDAPSPTSSARVRVRRSKRKGSHLLPPAYVLVVVSPTASRSACGSSETSSRP